MARQYSIKDENWLPYAKQDLLGYRNDAARLRAIVDSQPDCVKIVSRDYKLVDMNLAGLEMIDCYHMDEVRGADLFGVVDEEYHSVFKKSIDDAYAGKTTDVEFNITGLRGSKRRMSQHCAPIYNSEKSGEIIEAVAVSRDVTDQYEAYIALEEAKFMAERANNVKSNFLATMSHEFRTPLNAIIGFSEIIKSESFGKIGNDRYRDYIADIYESGHHLLDLINDVLDISEIEADKRILTKEMIDVDVFIQRCVSSLKVIAQRREVEINLDIEEDLPELFADRRSLKQVLNNLISNAIKFSTEKSAVLIKASHRRDHMVIKVCDEGIGIPEKDLRKITNPFFRGQEEAMIAAPGTGLGLSIVKSLVDAHGGTLMFESQEHIGTIATVTFPILCPISERKEY
ncbi:PAS domain-containing sensor histidine kinase [Pseudemcibacter aquimaris]|uniref:PAS domain-containing sensor histidine kinase n=1 Tax=Pseudemcibacter aquimaris TaxID=2857064 RepID=UPI002011348E|nr:PAS domain-containing sensor histidine kinase [Pseudemcibacter aquimaris]MCC3859951.1 PAS domain-containing sensor histidine kinase [Pseudemcibacter aquimaris]WDU57283.1 PAS domain-containing sensor histidine kinase [Pseudemcibacter aquimaris]